MRLIDRLLTSAMSEHWPPGLFARFLNKVEAAGFDLTKPSDWEVRW